MKKIFYSIYVISFLSACTKEGTGGQNTIAAFPKHHSKSIPGATIYIKYGTENFPGEDVSKYDDSKIAESEGGEAHVHFEELKKGSYYLYGVGYDSSISQVVKGGIPVNLNSKSGETSVIVPITED